MLSWHLTITTDLERLGLRDGLVVNRQHDLGRRSEHDEARLELVTRVLGQVRLARRRVLGLERRPTRTRKDEDESVVVSLVWSGPW